MIFNVLDYGAKGDGTADDTDAIQAAIDDCTGNSDPLKNGRLAKGQVYLPSGIYKVTKPLKIWSVSYITFNGDGKSTRICPVGVMGCVLDLNGVAFSTISDFLIEGNELNETVEDVIYFYTDYAGTARTSTNCIFRNIQIQNINFTTGFRIGKYGSNNQVDTSSYENITISGPWAVSAGKAETGLMVGSTAWGNNCIHSFWNCSVVNCKVGVNVSAMPGFLFCGGSFGKNDIDFIINSTSYVRIEGMRSESSGRFFVSNEGATGISANITLADILFNADEINGDGYVIKGGNNGTLLLQNFYINASQILPKIYLVPFRSCSLIIDGFTSSNTIDGLIADCNPAVDFHIRGYIQTTDGAISDAPKGLRISGPIYFGGGGTGVIRGNTGPLQFNVEKGSSQSGCWFGDGKGNVTAALTGEGAWTFLQIPDKSAMINSIFFGSQHYGKPCLKDEKGDIYLFNLTKVEK